MPGTLAVAFNCVALSAVPGVILAGVLQAIAGVAFPTVMARLAAAVVWFAASVGVNVTVRLCAAPAGSTVPAGGV